LAQNITYRVELLGSDGKRYTQSIEGLRKDLNIDGVRDYLFAQIKDRRDEIEYIEKHFKQLFLDGLRPNFHKYLTEWHPKSFYQGEFCRGFNNAYSIPFMFRNLIYDLFDESVKSGMIVKKSHGWFQAAVTP
jgi:hypothetical protein